MSDKTECFITIPTYSKDTGEGVLFIKVSEIRDFGLFDVKTEGQEAELWMVILNAGEYMLYHGNDEEQAQKTVNAIIHELEKRPGIIVCTP